MNKKRIIQTAGVVSIATVIVRLAGLFREMVSAYFFGTTLVYDAFLLAFMIPNFFRGILAEGGLNSAFIPVFADYLTPEKKNEAQKVISDTLGISLFLTVSLSALFLLFSSIAIFLPLSHKAILTLSFLRFTIFYLVFVSLSALVMGILNSLGHFASPALSPLGLDLFWVASIVFIAPLFGIGLVGRTYGLIIGLLIGGLFQLLIPVPALLRRGFSLKPSFNFRNPALIKMGSLLLPVIIGVAVAPINILVDYFLASTIAPGMVSSLWYATRLMQLPIGVFGVTMGTIALPSLSRLAVDKDWPEMKKTLLFSLKLTFFLVIPASFGLIFFRQPIIQLLFQHGLFTSHSTRATSSALLFYSLGLFAYSGGIVLTRAFYALKDTKTPVRIGLLSIVINLILDLMLMGPLKQGGIALSTSLVGLCNFALLFFFLRRKVGLLGGRSLLRSGMEFVVSSALATLIASIYFQTLQPVFGFPQALISAFISGGLFYFGINHLRRKFTLS